MNALAQLHELAMLTVNENGLAPIPSEIVDVATATSGADLDTIQLLDTKTSNLRIVTKLSMTHFANMD